jgi:dGTPase
VRHIGDYIAGMTDRFAIDRFADIFGRDAVPEALAHA